MKPDSSCASKSGQIHLLTTRCPDPLLQARPGMRPHPTLLDLAPRAPRCSGDSCCWTTAPSRTQDIRCRYIVRVLVRFSARRDGGAPGREPPTGELGHRLSELTHVCVAGYKALALGGSIPEGLKRIMGGQHLNSQKRSQHARRLDFRQRLDRKSYPLCRVGLTNLMRL